MEIKKLFNEGCKIRQIARITGYSRNTVRKALRNGALAVKARKCRISKLDAFKDHVSRRYYGCDLSAVRIQEEIRPMGYGGSVDTVRKFLRALRKERRNSQTLTVRFETPPGKQSQADWGHCGIFPDGAGGTVSVCFFTMVLSYSRMLFVKFCTSMELGSLMERHREAFSYFGGWTSEILYDNMSQVRKGPGRLNPLFADFALHHGFSVKTHRPYRPRTKGKVERAVDYVKESFLNGREFNGLDDLNARVLHWMENTANVRIHGTTGRRPCDLFSGEKLIPVSSAPPYVHVERVVRKVGVDARVLFGRSSYTVPPAEAGRAVVVEHLGQRIVIRSNGLVIAEHPAAARPGMDVSSEEHIADLWKLSLNQSPPPERSWNVVFNESVQTRPLDIYEREAVQP